MAGGAGNRELFYEEITTINLRRIWWIVISSTAVNLGIFLYNMLSPAMRIRDMALLQLADFVVSGLLLWAIWFLRGPDRQPARPRWRKARGICAVVFAVLVLAFMNGYYFRALPVLGENASYVLGLLTIGVVILLPPVALISLLGLNHIIYCGILLMMELTPALRSTALLDGTAGLLVALLAGIFLHQARWSEFSKKRIIAERNRELEQSYDEINEIMSIAAHDLRSPLLGLQHWLEATMSRPEAMCLRGSLDEASGTCRRMLDLITRLLDAHAVENGDETQPLVPTDLGRRLALAGERHQTQADAKFQNIETKLPVAPVLAEVHAPSLDQILDNLVSNALKFSPPESTVWLSLTKEGGEARIAISDEGPGIPEDERKDLFRKFARGSAQPTGDEPSTGLGLFIVRKLVDGMGGSVACQSHVPNGTTFLLRLPVCDGKD